MKTKEDYFPGYAVNASNFMTFRTAQSHAAFLLPRLRAGLRLLDCGCGPGTITLGLARLVSPAQVVGLDREPSQVERARAAARERGVENVGFETGSVYDLPFNDESFEVVFAHAVFEHLREPLTALAEIRRVLVPGGLAAVRSPDWGGFLIAPMTPQLRDAIAYYSRLQMQSGGDVHVGRKLKALLLRAGFRDLEYSASYECYRSLESIGEYLAQGIERSSKDSSTSIDLQRINSGTTALRSWSRCHDGVFAQSWCEILGTK